MKAQMNATLLYQVKAKAISAECDSTDVLQLVSVLHARQVQFQSSKACFPPQSSNVPINRGHCSEEVGKQVEAVLTTEFLSDFLLEVCYQMPIIRALTAPLRVFPLCSITDSHLWMAGICCSSIIFLILMSLKKQPVYCCSCMNIFSRSNNRLYIPHPVIEGKNWKSFLMFNILLSSGRDIILQDPWGKYDAKEQTQDSWEMYLNQVDTDVGLHHSQPKWQRNKYHNSLRFRHTFLTGTAQAHVSELFSMCVTN